MLDKPVVHCLHSLNRSAFPWCCLPRRKEERAMALSAQYSGTHQSLNCRACDSADTKLRQQSLAHIAGSTGMLIQTRIEVDCKRCGQVSVYWFGGDEVKVE